MSNVSIFAKYAAIPAKRLARAEPDNLADTSKRRHTAPANCHIVDTLLRDDSHEIDTPLTTGNLSLETFDGLRTSQRVTATPTTMALTKSLCILAEAHRSSRSSSELFSGTIFRSFAQARARLLQPLINTLFAFYNDRLLVPHGQTTEMQDTVLVSLFAWRKVLKTGLDLGYKDIAGQELMLYEHLAEEVVGSPGPACREILRKANEDDSQNQQWGAYGWEWIRHMNARHQPIYKAETDSKSSTLSFEAAHMYDFPTALVSLPEEIHLMIVYHLKVPLADRVSLRATNQFFRRIITRPTQSELTIQRLSKGNADRVLWYVCQSCVSLLHRSQFNAFPRLMVENALRPVCLQCGTRSLPNRLTLNKVGHRYPDVDCDGYCKVLIQSDAARYRLRPVDTLLGGYIYGPGYRWIDDQDQLWLRCRWCWQDCIERNPDTTMCVGCGPTLGGPDDRRCSSCCQRRSLNQFDLTRNKKGWVERLERVSDYQEDVVFSDDEEDVVCMPCGTRDLGRYNPVYDERDDLLYDPPFHNVQNPGLRFGMRYIWTDQNRTAWKRCALCRGPTRIIELDNVGQCPTCT